MSVDGAVKSDTSCNVRGLVLQSEVGDLASSYNTWRMASHIATLAEGLHR